MPTLDSAQSEHQIKLKTALGSDVLLVQEFSAHEGFSELFEFHLTLLSKEENIEPKKLVGTNVTIEFTLDDGSSRYFNGFVAQLMGGHRSSRDLRSYQAVVVPWLWFLTKRSDCRIFQFKSVKDIITDVFSELGFSDYQFQLSGNHPTRDYCVQYRESDFNFVTRLMEEEGIYYYFQQEDGKHTLVMSDSTSTYKPAPESELKFDPNSSEEATVKSWEHQYQFRTGKFAQTDYNFTMPSTSLATDTSTILDLPNISKYEVYDYPNEYQVKNDGAALAKLRMEEEEAAFDIVVASTGCRTLLPGGTFKITEHETDAEDGKEYVIISVKHEAIDPSYLHEENAEGESHRAYRNRITCIPKTVVFRPERTTPKPQIHGSQTGMVVGPSGEEIYTDEYSRIKVHFHWDRLGKKDDNSSCWVRVATSWAGKKWGMVSIPRIGQEVVVSFLEGDPDRPLVIGSVYNAEQMPPYALPANKTQSGWKSRSSKGGSPDNFNEIRFEDKKGDEEMYIHAEKNQSTIVENDRTQEVGNDHEERIGNNKAMTTGNNHTETIGTDMSVSVGRNLTETVGVNYMENVGAAMEVNVGAMMTITVGAAKAETVGNTSSETVGSNKSISIGKDLTEAVDGNKKVTIKKDRTDTIKGQHKETVDKEFLLSAKKIQLVAKDEISIKVGSAEILMKKNGDINVKGKKINIKGSGDIVMKGSNIKEN